MEIGFYPRYDRMGASSRLRFFQYFDRWQGGGTVKIHPGLRDGYLKELYRAGSVSRGRKFTEWLRLLWRAFGLEKQVIIEYELLPNVPWSVEKRLLAGHRYILNFDDMVWEKYRNIPELANKFDELCRHADGVIVANQLLFDKVAGLNSNVILIPTVVDLDAFKADCGKFEHFTVAWIGTPVTYGYLEQNLAALQAMSRKCDFELLVIAGKSLAKRPLEGVRVRYEDWSMETEAELLKRSHVGIMPLADDNFSHGKSAFKLIQYQAAGIPSIASPVGENCRVITGGKNGFLADTPEAWSKALYRLTVDRALYRKMSEEARRRAFDYSIQKYQPILEEFVRKTFAQ